MKAFDEFLIQSESELELPISRLDRLLQPGDGVAFEGELGAGKTTFVRHFLLIKGYQDPVVSPTYPLLIEYEIADQKYIHIDGFRLDGKSPDPWDHREWSQAILFVEWPEKTRLPKSRFKYRIKIETTDQKRLITFFSN